jgi:sodium-dependent dicarboxylate transporter 2/3/5
MKERDPRGTFLRNCHRAPNDMHEPKGTLSRAEERFEQQRQRAGLLLAPVVLALLWFAPIGGLEPPAHRLLAILGAIVTLWVSEAIPLPVTALLGPALCVLAGIGPARDVFKSFADPILFLFIGSFMLAEAMFHHGLNRRIAFQILGLKSVGESPARLLLAFGCITGFMSMWISNTTTTAMMYPIGLAILGEMARRKSAQSGREVRVTGLKFAGGLMLMTAMASAAGGLATPVGAAPNLIAIGMIQKSAGVPVPFFKWMVFGLPIALALVAFLVVYLNRVCPADPQLMDGNAAWIQSEKAKLGPLTRGESNVLLAFGLTVLLWLLPGVLALVYGADSAAYRGFNQRLPEGVVALLGAALLFVLPVHWGERRFSLTWNEARRIDWGTVLLFGGGLALGDLMFSTGLAEWIGVGLARWLNARTTFGLVVLFTLLSTAVTQVASNTAAAAMAVPVAIAVAQAAGVDPVPPALAACLGAGLGCMLPISTPPMAIVHGSGCIPLSQMIRHGLVLNLVGSLLIIGVVTWLVPLLF